MVFTSRARVALAAGSALALTLSGALVAGPAGAASMTGVYNAAAAKLVPAAYKHATLQVATDATYAPDEMMSGSKVVGFDVNIIDAVAKTLGIKVQENNVSFDTIIAGMLANKYQIGNSSFTDTKAREKQVNFVDYFVAGEGVYVLKSSKATFSGLKSFCGHTVAVETSTTEQTDATNASKSCTGGKKVTVLNFTTQTEANQAVLSGHATYGFLDSQIADYVVATSGGKFKSVGMAINVAPYGIATQKNAKGLALAKAIRAALKVMIANGTYAAILKHFGVQAGAVAASKVVLNGATS
jgi:polar amino acid transport system substrate-binding protein